jgi:hypothetical protein
MAKRGVTALISPEHRGFVSSLLPSLVFPTHLDFGRDFAGINTQVDSTGGRIVVMMVGQRGRARALLRWNLPETPGAPARRVSSDEDVAKMADELTRMFGSSALKGGIGEGEEVGLAALRHAIGRPHRGQADIADALAEVLDLPELRERVDKRIVVGPVGPGIEYPARLCGPTELIAFTKFTQAARSLSPDSIDSVMLGPRWSDLVDPHYAVIEVIFSGTERCLKVYKRDAPSAAKVWNERWRLTPGPPDALDDILLEELDRVMPWQWNRKDMRELLRTAQHPDALGEFAKITGVPSLEPLADAPDWSAICPSARIIPRASGPSLFTWRTKAALGSRLRWGSWRPLPFPRGRPTPAAGLATPD